MSIDVKCMYIGRYYDNYRFLCNLNIESLNVLRQIYFRLNDQRLNDDNSLNNDQCQNNSLYIHISTTDDSNGILPEEIFELKKVTCSEKQTIKSIYNHDRSIYIENKFDYKYILSICIYDASSTSDVLTPERISKDVNIIFRYNYL